MKVEVVKVATTKPELKVSFGGFSSKGSKSVNQDAFAMLDSKGQEKHYKGIIACIADGCSSAKYAKDAANLAVTHFIREYTNTPLSWSVKKSSSKVLASLNQWLYSQSNKQNNHGYRQADWLATFSALILKSTTAYIFHLGDTRISVIRDGNMQPLTRDHKTNQVLTKALGAELHQDVDLYEFDLQEGDIFVLTCDGVHDFVTSRKIIDLVFCNANLEHAAKLICDEAQHNDSDDNLTCLLIKVTELPQKCLAETYKELTYRKVPLALRTGQKIDGFTVIRQIHASSRSHIYLAQQGIESEPCVLKVPSINFQDDLHYLQGFMREGWAGQLINHANVMKVISTAPQSQFLYHVCEYMDGQTLRQWMHDVKQPTIAQVRSILEQIVTALRAFQRLDMVHRDLKPENIMIDANAKVTIIDYGTVSCAGLDEDITQLNDECAQGSVGYTAPETILTLHADFKSDLFSLGVIAYELLCSELPYKTLQPQNYHKLDYSFWQYRSIRSYRKDIPFWLDQALMKAVAPQPQHRYQALSEFIKDIRTQNSDITVATRQFSFYQRHTLIIWKTVAIVQFLMLLVFTAIFSL